MGDGAAVLGVGKHNASARQAAKAGSNIEWREIFMVGFLGRAARGAASFPGNAETHLGLPQPALERDAHHNGAGEPSAAWSSADSNAASTCSARASCSVAA